MESWALSRPDVSHADTGDEANDDSHAKSHPSVTAAVMPHSLQPTPGDGDSTATGSDGCRDARPAEAEAEAEDQPPEASTSPNAEQPPAPLVPVGSLVRFRATNGKWRALCDCAVAVLRHPRY